MRAGDSRSAAPARTARPRPLAHTASLRIYTDCISVTPGFIFLPYSLPGREFRYCSVTFPEQILAFPASLPGPNLMKNKAKSAHFTRGPMLFFSSSRARIFHHAHAGAIVKKS